MQRFHHAPKVGGGGQRPFEVNSFHVTLIGVMVKIKTNMRGHIPRPPGGGAHVHMSSKQQQIPQHSIAALTMHT